MAKIVFISRYYLPEKAAAAVCVSEMAQELAALGHQVSVVTTFPNYPTGIVPAAYRGKLMSREVINGVQVIRVWSSVSANRGFLRRILAQLSFGFTSPWLARHAIGKPDMLIVGSPPLFNVIAARLLSWMKHCPFIFWVADLWPESAVQLGALRNPLLIKLSEWLEWSTYQRAKAIWAVTEGMRDTLLRRGLPPERVFLITNGVNTEKFRPLSQEYARKELGWNQRFTAIYVGTHGLSHGLTTILEAAKQLRAREDIRFIFVGDGADKANLVSQANRERLTNVTFLDPQPHERVPLLLAAADVCLVHVRNIPIFTGMLPIKMYEAMACGRPMLLAVDGEARRLAAEALGAAIYVEPENPSALASALISLQVQPELAQAIGQRGREYVCTHFDYQHLALMLHEKLVGWTPVEDEVSAQDIPISVH